MKRKQFAVRAICAAVAQAMVGPTLAQTNEWEGFNSTSWIDSANWVPNGTVPVAGEDVVVTDAYGGSTTVDYDETSSPSYKTLLIDGVTVIHNDTGGLQVQETMTVGADGVATYDLSVGRTLTIDSGGKLVVGANSLSSGSIVQDHAGSIVQVGGDLILGQAAGAFGSYQLTLGQLNVTAALVVGDAGEGEFTQDGGSVSAGQLVLGRKAGGVGSYHLNGGTLNDNLIVGDAGTGVFNNNGATHNVTGDLVLGNQATGNGTYNLSLGGTTTVTANTIVGNAGTGTFNHGAGTHTTNDLVLANSGGASGTYNLTDANATLTVKRDFIVGKGDTNPGSGGMGLVVQNNGDVTAKRLRIGGYSDGANSFFGVGRYELNGGTVTVSDSTDVGSTSQGRVVQTGGTMNAGKLTIGSSGLFSVSDGSGGYLFFSDGVYELLGGTLNTNGTTVSLYGLGTFEQTGPSLHKVTGDLVVAAGPELTDPASGQVRNGTYTLNSGDLQVSGNTVVGAGNNSSTGEPGGLGSFYQYSGSVDIGGNLIVGGFGTIGSGTGSYGISGGSLTAANMVVAQSGATGGVYQSGGAVTVTGFLTVGEGSGSIGQYNLSDGTLTAGNTIIAGALVVEPSLATGSFSQSGGTFNTGFLNIGGGGFTMKGYGFYGMTGGSLVVADSLNIGNAVGGDGIFDQSAGSVQVNGVLGSTSGLYVNNGSYKISGTVSTLAVANDLIVGGVGGALSGVAGQFRQSGTTTVTVGRDLRIALLGDSDGSYNLSGASSLTVTGITVVGDGGLGSFTQSGGTHTTDKLIVGAQVGSDGTYNLLGGTLKDDAIVGDAGVGMFNNSGGLHDVTGNLIVGNQATGQGTYNLSLTGELKVSNSITVGNLGTGNLSITNDSKLTANNRLTIGAGNNATAFQSAGNSVVTVGGLRVGEGAGSTASTYGMAGGTLNVVNTNGVDGGSRIGISGTGTFTQNGGTHNTTFMQIGGATFGQGSGGSGTYHLNGGALVSTGTVSIRPNADSATGVMNVAGGSLTAPLIINNDQLNYSGGAITATVNNAGQFNVSGAAPRTLTGTLDNNVGGTTNVAAATPFKITGNLNQNGGTIVANSSITVGTDYSNTGFGSGNSFNRYAGVTLNGGAQLIGENAAQTITATGNPLALTNTGSNTFTLDLGNVRGGSSKTVSYQVANNGIGASIRGAVQTAANGGNVTDARLSGSGVTAGNFGPITAGNNSGNLGVTFNAGSGGVLSGQSVAIYSNFDNVATQVINLTGQATTLATGNATPNANPVNLGNFRVGGASPSQSFAVKNLATGVGAERLGIGSVGTTGNFGAVNNLGAGFVNPGSTQGGAVSAQVSGGVAGVNNGSLTIQYTTNGELIDSTFTTVNSNSQAINLQATGYNAAAGSAAPAGPVNLGNVRVGGTLAQAFTVTNTAAAGSFSEDLNASFGSNTGHAANNGGSISGLLAGNSNNAAMSGSLSTASAGTKTGTVTIDYQTAGTVGSVGNGLGSASAGSQTITLNGAVFQAAAGQLNTAPLNFGTVQVGQVVQQTLSISNTASGAAGYVEDLNASFGATSGINGSLISGSGNISGLLAGGTNASNMVVSVDTSAAATINGAIAVNFFSAGAVGGVSNGLGTLAVGSADYGVSGIIQTGGQVIDQASPVINNSPINLGNVRVGAASPVGLVSVTNQATGNAQAALDATSITGNGPITASGSFAALLAPGGTNNTALQVGMNTGTAGAISGTATIAFVSDASNVGGCAPNCRLNLASQDVSVTGGVFQVAQPNLPTNLNLGNFRLGSAPTQAITITNTDVSAAGYQEGLDAAVGAVSGKAMASGGPIANLAQGVSSNAISVGIDNGSATAGANNGTVALNLASNGGGTSGLATLSLPDAVINVSGTGYRTANPTLNTPTVNVAARVGDAVAANQAVSITNTSPDAFTEGLKVSISGASGNAQHNGGSIANLGAGATNGSAIQVGLGSSATAGITSGTVTLALASTGAGTTGAADLALPSQNITVNGKVYTPAVAQLNTNALDFGIVRVGDVVAAQNVSVTNAAAATALNDTMAASMGAVSGPFSGSGSASGLGAGTSNAPGSLSVGLNTSSAGVFNGAAAVNFLSQNPDMADLNLGDKNVTLSVQINNLANALFGKTSGAGSFGCVSLVCTLDLGNVVQGSGLLATSLFLSNDVSGPADSLKGTFNMTAVDDFAPTGWFDPTDIAAGQSLTGLGLDFDPITLGLYSDTIVFNGFSFNTSDPAGRALAAYTLLIRANVIESGGTVPEPGSLAMVLLALAAALAAQRRRAGEQQA